MLQRKTMVKKKNGENNETEKLTFYDNRKALLGYSHTQVSDVFHFLFFIFSILTLCTCSCTDYKGFFKRYLVHLNYTYIDGYIECVYIWGVDRG